MVLIENVHRNNETALISGDAILPVLKALQVKFLLKKLLKRYNLEDVAKGNYYSMKDYLDLLDEVERTMPLLLKKIGTHIFTEAKFPPGIDTFEKALSVVDQAYYMNHKHHNDNIGHYHYTKLNDNEYLMTMTCPYPCSFDQGIIYGIANQFEKVISVKHKNGNCRARGSKKCEYLVRVR